MSLFLQRPLFACATAALGLSGAAYSLLSHQRRNPLRLDSNSNPISSSSSASKDWTFSQYQNNAQTPVVTSRGGLNAKPPCSLHFTAMIPKLASWNGGRICAEKY